MLVRFENIEKLSKLRDFIHLSWGIYCSVLTEMSHILDNSLAVNIIIGDLRRYTLKMEYTFKN